MNDMINRIRPVPLQEWSQELNQIRQRLGDPLNVHSVMAHHPKLMQAWMPFRYHIVRDSTITARQRELLILRTAVNCQSEYEWEHHVIRGHEAGLSDDEIQRVKAGPDVAGWKPVDGLLLLAADECHSAFKISDDTYRALSAHFDARQLLDIMGTVGMYLILALIVNTCQVPLEREQSTA